SRRRHTRFSRDWSSDVCSSDLQVWFYDGLGVMPQFGRPNDALALILFFLAVPVFTFWVTPLMAWLSRRDEFEADRYASAQASGEIGRASCGKECRCRWAA